MKKFLIIGVILTAGLNFCFAQGALKDRVAKVIKVEGDVQVMKKSSSTWVPAQEGMVLSEGDIIKTGKVGAALLNIQGDAEGSLVRLKESTTLGLDILKEDTSSNNKVTVLDLSLGKVFIQAEKLKEGSRFEVKTPTSVVGVRGTKFAVEVDTLE